MPPLAKYDPKNMHFAMTAAKVCTLVGVVTFLLGGCLIIGAALQINIDEAAVHKGAAWQGQGARRHLYGILANLGPVLFGCGVLCLVVVLVVLLDVRDIQRKMKYDEQQTSELAKNKIRLTQSYQLNAQLNY